MKIILPPLHPRYRRRQPVNGSLLIIVLWITFGLVSIALYFGHSIIFEVRASDQNAAGVEAEQAIEGAVRYLTFAITNAAIPGQMPDTNLYQFAAVPVGDATFWIIGRTNLDIKQDTPVYGLIDEASKMNLNTATIDMLEGLPMMTPQLAAAIIDWRDADEDITDGGAESETYLALNPPYRCKDAPFESVEELRLVSGMTMDLLYGEDANLNGVLDPNENDGPLTLPNDNHDGILDPGLMEFLTVYTREPFTNSYGTNRININSSSRTPLTTRLTDLFSQSRATEITSALPAAGTYSFTSLVDFYVRSRMTQQEFDQIADDLSTTNTFVPGLININTASQTVLGCIPGIGLDKANQVVAYRQANPAGLTSVAWLVQALDATSAQQAGPYVTTRSYQFCADIVAMGHHDRGYRRTCFIFDTSEGTPKVVYRRDRARLGWALGALPRQPDNLGGNNRTWRY
jgi:type II secretory pathway component PulK